MVRSIAKRARLYISSGERHSFGRLHQPRAGSSGAWKELRLLLLVLWLPLAAISALGQQSASVSGATKDATGLGIPGAKITLTNDKTAEIKSAISDASADYTFTGLAAGSYTIEASASGFASTQKAIVVAPGQALTADLALNVSSDIQSVSVSGASDPYSVLPTESTDAVFGLPQSVDQVPRTVSNVDSSLMNLYSAKSVDDLVAVIPGSYTAAYFGIAGSVFLRGDIADNYFRGFRRVENRGNYQTPISAASRIEIVEGPPSPIYGPGRIGGFMNFYPKTVLSEGAKWLDKGQGALVLRYGQYEDKIGSLEYGLPFKVSGHRAGVYAFFEDKDSRSFYKDVYDRYSLGQIAFDMEVSPKWKLAYGFQGFGDGAIQALGWNRVTQDLIDHGTYLTGHAAINLSSNNFNIGPNDVPAGLLNVFAYEQNFGPDFLTTPNAPYFALDPASIGTVHLASNRILVDKESDFLNATTYTAYFDVVGELKPGVTFKNQTFFDRLESKKYSSYGFGAKYTPWVMENKSTLSFSWRPNSVVKLNAFAGYDFTRLSVFAGEERNDYQVVNRRDISAGPTPNDRFQGPFDSTPAIAFQYLQQGSYTDNGLFWLSDINFRDRLNITLGARFDRYSPNFSGRDSGYGPLTHASATNNAPILNGSASYRLPFHLTPYFTAATSRFLDLGQGNEIDYSEIPGGTYIQPSSLYEGGVKTNFNEKFYGSFAYFRQKRSAFDNQALTLDFFKNKGAEMELRAFLLRRFTFTGAFTWQEPQILNSPFLLSIPPNLLNLTPQQAYGGKFVGDASIFPHATSYAVAGQPHWVASPFGTMNVTKSTGFLLGTTWVSSVTSGYVSGVVLPSYALTRTSVFYRRERYEITVGVSNIFNARYFQSQYLFEDSLVKPGELRTVSGTWRYTF
jgi:iron complex outermembrane receptor protein